MEDRLYDLSALSWNLLCDSPLNKALSLFGRHDHVIEACVFHFNTAISSGSSDDLRTLVYERNFSHHPFYGQQGRKMYAHKLFNRQRLLMMVYGS